METVELGRTGITVSRLCMGCWQAAGGNWASADDERFIRTVRHGLDAGLNFLDTAVGYGRGHSEEMVGQAVAGRRDRVVIATKFGHGAPERVVKALDDALGRIGTDYIDLFQYHWPQPGVPLADTIGALERLREQGKIRAIGVSNWMEPEWDDIDDPSRVDTLQPCYSLLWRSIEPRVLPLCRRHQIAIIPYSPLCQGILAGRFRSLDDVPDDIRQSNQRLKPECFEQVQAVVDALEQIARKHDRTLAQTALRWLLDQDGVTAPIVGASRPEQVDDNLGALGWQLEPADRRHLSEVSWPLSADLKPYDTLWNWHPKVSS